MPALWDSKMILVSVFQFLRLPLFSPFGSVSGPFVTPCPIVSLGGNKKKKGKKEREEQKRKKKYNRPPADFKPIV